MLETLRRFAKTLRKDSTRAEALLWHRLRAKQLAGIKFRRQEPIGHFIVDFVSFEKRVIIELDGGQHVQSAVKDGERDAILAQSGFNVLRFWSTPKESWKQYVKLVRSDYHPPLAPPVKGGGPHFDYH